MGLHGPGAPEGCPPVPPASRRAEVEPHFNPRGNLTSGNGTACGWERRELGRRAKTEGEEQISDVALLGPGFQTPAAGRWRDGGGSGPRPSPPCPGAGGISGARRARSSAPVTSARGGRVPDPWSWGFSAPARLAAGVNYS